MPKEKQPNKEPSSLPPIRTFKSDTKGYLRRKNLSLDEIALKESKEKKGRLKTKKLHGFKRVLIIGSLSILAALFGFFIWPQIQGEPFIVDQPMPLSLIISEEEKVLTASTTAELKSKIKNELEDKSLENRAIRRLAINRQNLVGQKIFLDGENFLFLSETDAPTSLLDSLAKRFYLGLFSDKAVVTNWPILIFEIETFDQAFAGMLSWEGRIIDDLLFLTPENVNTETGGASFTDEVVKNQDIRLIKNIEDKSILLYTFFDKRFLIIAFNQKALETAIDRLVQSLPLN